MPATPLSSSSTGPGGRWPTWAPTTGCSTPSMSGSITGGMMRTPRWRLNTAGTGAPPMTVTADFGSGVETRTFYSAYFVLDITNPEQDPKLLWVFTDPTLGLATTYPAVLRVNPSADGKTSNTSAKWLMVVGSGPTGYNGSSVQAGKMFAINLATGPG